jgi:sulfur-oxidizing protein SoxY
MITSNRRDFIKKVTGFTGYSLLSASGLLESQLAYAEWVAADFEPSPLNQTLQNLLKDKPVIDTDKIILTLPKIVDSKTPVLVTVQSELKDALAISILVEQNPAPLVATFELSSQLDTFISARLKFIRTSFVFVLVETEKVFYSTKAMVTVSTSGCGT